MKFSFKHFFGKKEGFSSSVGVELLDEKETEQQTQRPEAKNSTEVADEIPQQLIQDYERFEEELKKIDVELEGEEEKKLAGLEQEAQAGAQSALKKISDALGSNPGGWYQEQETGRRQYIKFYDKPDRARIEHLTNLLYKKLGIKVADTQLLTLDGKLAISSSEIEGSQATNLEDQKASPEVRNGFVADAYLANWDVVGLNYDNIVRSSEGSMIRIDNGGSLVFRAQGGKKHLAPTDIPELTSMRNPDFPAGRVFAGLTENEIKQQALDLIVKLTDEDVEALAAESGLEGPMRDEVVKALKGRRQFLVETYGHKKPQGPAERLPVAIERLRIMIESLREIELRPRVAFLADSDKIENQEVDVVTREDDNEVQVFFKLTEAHYRKILSKFSDSAAETTIRYKGKNDSYDFCSAYSKSIGEFTIEIANSSNMRSSLGLVRIRVTGGAAKDKINELGQRLHQLIIDQLEIADGLNIPESQAETTYKRARYAWHHKLPEAPEGIEQKLTREEVFPDYFTVVETGKHKEYQAVSPYAVFHNLQDAAVLPNIIKAGGLLSTHERFRRGLLLHGMSSAEDMSTGGGDSVFTRTVTRAGINRYNSNETNDRMALVFDPEILDRTDWYAYDTDKYGKTDAYTFSTRQSPEELFRQQTEGGYVYNNEQMFRLGLPISKVKAITCAYEAQMIKAYVALSDSGITEINGKPIEAIIIQAAKLDDYISLAEGDPATTKSLAELMIEKPALVEEIERIRYYGVVEFGKMLQGEFNNLQYYYNNSKNDDNSYEMGQLNVVMDGLGNIDAVSYMKDYGFSGDLANVPGRIRGELMDKISKLENLIDQIAGDGNFRNRFGTQTTGQVKERLKVMSGLFNK